MNDAFNYIAVLLSIVVGLTATRVMSGLSEMIQVANRRRIYWVHIVWHIILAFEVMLSWWLLYRWRTVSDWTLLLFIWVTVVPITLYLAAAILIPGELETTGSPNWHDYYFKNRRGFFLVFGAIAPARYCGYAAQRPAALPRPGTWISRLYRLLDNRLYLRRYHEQ